MAVEPLDRDFLYQPLRTIRAKPLAVVQVREMTRIGPRVIKRYHPPAPGVARVLAHRSVAETGNEPVQAIWKLRIR